MIIPKSSHIFRQAQYDSARSQSEPACTELDEAKTLRGQNKNLII
jgi:hypothetical protein